MPTVHRMGKHKIQVFPDHAPPHFHVKKKGCCSYKVEIGTWKILRGTACRAHGEIIGWACDNADVLLAKWTELNERD